MSRKRMALATLAVWLLSLIWHWPAAWWVERVPLLRQQCAQSLVRGSVWQGEIEPVRWDGHAVTERLAWQIQPAYLLLGEAVVVLSGPWGHADLRRSWSRWRVLDLKLEVPIAQGAPWIEPLQRYGVQGQLQLEAPELQWGDQGLTGQAQARLLRAQSNLTNALVWGDYQAQLQAKPEDMRLQIRTLQGPLFLEGQLQQQGGGRALALKVRPDASVNADFSGLLQALGPAGADGSRYLRYSF